MVLMKSAGFSSGLGLDVHVRTTRIDNSEYGYSYISGIAIKLGDDIVEATTDGGLIINSKDTEFSNRKNFGGVYLTSKVKGAKRNIFVHDLHLGEANKIQIRANTKTGMLFIDVSGIYPDSIGLLGSNEGLFARDGKTNMEGYWNALGEEWQVRNVEAKLFIDQHREPQHPAGCVYSGAKKRKTNLRRNLIEGSTASVKVGIDAASEACKKMKRVQREFCISDIMATGDLELASDPFYN